MSEPLKTRLAVCGQFSKVGSLLGSFLLRVPYYIGDLKGTLIQRLPMCAAADVLFRSEYVSIHTRSYLCGAACLCQCVQTYSDIDAE